MIKKLVVCSLLVISIFGMGLFKEEKASAAYITASPKEQRIINVLAYANWHVSWSGVGLFNVAYQPDTYLDWQIVAANTGATSTSYKFRYDLGTSVIKKYNGRFVVLDDFDVAYTNVIVNHVRTN